MTTPDDALLWARKTAAKGFHPITQKAILDGKWDTDMELVIRAEAFRAGQAHVAGLLEALEDQIDGCSMIVRMLSGQESSVAHSLRAMLNAQIDAARAAIAAAKGVDQ